MSEQYKQDADTQGQEIDDDPLAELARIVAGEPELNPQPEVAVVEEAPTEETSIEDAFSEETPIDEAPTVDASMEAALEEQLMNEFSSDESSEAEMVQEPVAEVEAPSFVEDINSTIEQISTAEAVETGVPYSQESAETFAEAEATESAQPQETNPEVGFQDGLIDALELEIGGEPTPEPVLETMQLEEAFQAPLDEAYEATAETEVAQDPVAEVEMHASNVQSTLEQELTDHYESYETPAQEPEVVYTSEEPAYEAPVEEVAEVIDEPVASIEEDLGAAFDSEFEQLAAQQPEPEAVFPVEETAAETVAAPAMQETPQAEPSLEMDFEAAFAEELEVAGVPETQGWAETETEDANAAFTAAASPSATVQEQTDFEAGLDRMENDPGHVGSVEEIAAVDTGAVAANDNGGGMKFAIAALVLALFAGAIAAGYGFLGGDENTTVAASTPEIIKADADPVKVKPKDPGGVVPENQDNASYVDIGGENSARVSQETLNSQTEEPLILNTGPKEETEVASAPKSDDRLTSSEDAGATPNATNSAVQPKVVQTVVVKPDGTILTKPAAPKPVTAEAVKPEPEAPKPVETALNTPKIVETANVEVKPVSTQVIKKPEAIDGAKSTNDIAVPVASPLPKPAPAKKVVAAPKPKKAAPAPARKSEWVVQVSSQRTPEAAQSSFSNMRNKYSVLQGRAMSIQRANVNGTTYYRVRVQTASRDDANQLCTSLATAGGSCFVTR